MFPHSHKYNQLKRGELKRETEFVLISAQNNAIITNYTVAKFDDTQNTKFGLYGDRYEAIINLNRAKSVWKVTGLGILCELWTKEG